MKNILLVSVLFLSACGGSGDTRQEPKDNPAVPQKDVRFLVAGQSNAVRCDWDYLDISYKSIAVGSQSIQDLIDIYVDQDYAAYDGILFVHGEQDAYLLTDPKIYVDKVEEYRKMIGLPIYISTVGYDFRYSGNHDQIRDAVNSEAKANKNWTVTFNEAQYFPELGNLLGDGVHFNQQGCEMMMDYILP